MRGLAALVQHADAMFTWRQNASRNVDPSSLPNDPPAVGWPLLATHQLFTTSRQYMIMRDPSSFSCTRAVDQSIWSARCSPWFQNLLYGHATTRRCAKSTTMPRHCCTIGSSIGDSIWLYLSDARSPSRTTWIL